MFLVGGDTHFGSRYEPTDRLHDFACCIRYRLGLRWPYNSKTAPRASFRRSDNLARLISRMRCVHRGLVGSRSGVHVLHRNP